MALFQSTNFSTAQNQGSTSAGIQGGNLQIRSTVAAGKQQTVLDTYTIPASSGPQIGDSIEWFPTLFPMDTLFELELFYDALGTGCLVSLGKIDPNNSANTSTTWYLSPSTAAVAGSVSGNANLWEQVGADPSGDQTTGNLAPSFGSADIILTTTFTGAAPTAGAVLKLVASYISGT